MEYGFVKLAAVTPRVKPGDTEYNARNIISLMTEAIKNGAEVAVFPEMCVAGYTSGDLFLSETLLSGTEAALEKIRDASAGFDTLFFIGFPARAGGKLYSAAAAVSNGSILGVVPKINLPDYGVFYESRYFSAGGTDTEIKLCGKSVPMSDRIIFQAENNPALTVACEICEDLWAVNAPSASHAGAGAAVIVNPSASPETAGKHILRTQAVTAQSERLSCAYVYAGAGEGESSTDSVFAGARIISEAGCVISEGELLTSGATYADADLEYLFYLKRRKGGNFAAVADYKIIPFRQAAGGKLTRRYSSAPFLPSSESEAELLLSLQAEGLASRLLAVGAKPIIGLSGGLDSTLALLVSLRAVKKLGRKARDIIAVTMPGFGTGERTLKNALRLIELSGSTGRTVDISAAAASHLKDIGHSGEKDVAYENSQARERTQVLMDIANSEGGLVVGTGDLSEAALGWSTYNGDHMSMYNPNASVPKTLVRHLVKYEAERLPELKEALWNVLNTDISPELLPAVNGAIAQKTEEIIGPYELNDFFLYHTLKSFMPPEKLLFVAQKTFEEKYAAAEIKKRLKVFYTRFFASQYKRSCSPDGPKVTEFSLSPRGDFRLPSDASPVLWLKALEEE